MAATHIKTPMGFPQGFKPWNFKRLPTFSSLCLSPMQTGSHFASPSSIEKRIVSSGLEPPTFNLQFRVLTTKPLSHMDMVFLRLSQSLRFLDLNISPCLLQSRSFYKSYLYGKNNVSVGVEPLTFNLQLRTLFTNPQSHVLIQCLRLSQYHRFLDLNFSQCLGHFEK